MTRARDDAKTSFIEERAAISTISYPDTSANCTVPDCSANEEARLELGRKRSAASTTVNVPHRMSAELTKGFAVRENDAKAMITTSKQFSIAKASAKTLFNYSVEYFLYMNIMMMVFANRKKVMGKSTEPKCIQGQAYRNQFGDFVTCNSGVGCPSNYECYYDGNQWGCCPTKGHRLFSKKFC
ncbi:hypothetical protein NECAME_02510 [Necator americanus]|uniref:Uncharacterized protein n=1 Tax=Necator americanus TaxID=51031 RepID=W2TFQ9_NECAM|nr:hypothetical protein NECAME_02510 [Necator americanus]ETN80031.1 hypothetical protein NECAME_02510 [Necator americanus]